MYNSFAEMRAELTQLHPDLQDDIVRACWYIYQSALHARNNLLVVGRMDDIDVDMMRNLGTNDAQLAEIEPAMGSILRDPEWTIVLNDAWVLGGIHGQAEFHLASPRNMDNIWDTAHNRLTVTGRELLGITHFGYERRDTVGQEEGYQCINGNTAQIATFEEYYRMIALAESDPNRGEVLALAT